MSRRSWARLWALPLAPALMTAAYVLNAGFSAGVYAQTLVRPLLLGALGAILITAGCVAITRRADRGGLLALGLLLAIVAGGAVGTVLTRMTWIQGLIWAIPLLAAGGLAVRISRRRWRNGRRVPPAQRLNACASLLVSAVLITGVASGRGGDFIGDIALTGTTRAMPTSDSDIIVILLDGYPRADTLARLFELDNSAFLDALASRGFVVSEGARSNYAWTELTLLSMLHMQPAQDISAFADRAALGGSSQPWLRDLTNDNPVFELVRDAGYRVVTVAPSIDHVTLRSADVVYTPPGLSDFEVLLLSSTALAGTASIVDPTFFARDQRDQVLWSLETIERVASNRPGGRLILGHVMSPHLPAVFNQDGSLRAIPFDHTFYLDFRALVGTAREEWARAYAGQVEYLNLLVLDTLDRVISRNPDATIVLMSDHGSGSEYRADTLDTDLPERFSTLFAARTPGLRDVFSADQTPLNLFPALLNARLGLQLPMKSDGSYAGYLDLVPLPGLEE